MPPDPYTDQMPNIDELVLEDPDLAIQDTSILNKPRIPNPKKDDPQKLADYAVGLVWTYQGLVTLRRFHGRWFVWRPSVGCYEQIPEDWVRSELYVLFHPHLSDKKCNSIMDALAGLCEVKSKSMPVFLEAKLAAKHDPNDIIAFQNGYIDVKEYIKGNPVLYRATPHWFSVESTGYPLNLKAKCPRWRLCLDEWFGPDQDAKDLLQEWFGYCLTSDTRAEKMLLVMGSPGTGKSTMMLGMQHMLGGKDRVGSTSLDSLNTQFGLQPLMGKNVIQLQEVRSSWDRDNTQALQRLISIVGRDPQYVDRKRVEGLANVVINCKFMMAANMPPRLPDNTGAFVRRMLVLDFDNGKGVASAPDPTLKDQLLLEAPGILLWALEGLKKLRAQNLIFSDVQSSNEKRLEMETSLNPLALYVSERLTIAANAPAIAKNVIYEDYLEWHKTYMPNKNPKPLNVFCRDLKGATAGQIKEARGTSSDGGKVRLWAGVILKKTEKSNVKGS